MKEIPLTQGKVALIDDDMYDRVSYFKWHTLINRNRGRNTFYATTNIQKGKTRTAISMHRLIMGFPQGLVVDHINMDGLDNQISNLRIADKSQNRMNTFPYSGLSLTSRYKGVCYNKIKNRYRAYISANHVQYQIGSYKTETEAALAYNKKAIELFGEFARLNDVV